MEPKELFQQIMVREIRPIYDTYMYGLENGWKMDDIIVAIIIESISSNITPDGFEKVSIMPQVHGALNDIFKTEFDLRLLIKATLSMRKENSYFVKRLDELNSEIGLDND